MKNIKNIILVGSGKGGVGKSTIAVNLSVALAQEKLNVGLLDADIYGPSIPKMLGIMTKPKASDNKKILPFEKFKIKFMSIGNLIPQDKAVVWRAPMVVRALNQLLQDIEWGELDILIIDLPPGTGDIQLSLSQNLNITGSVIVSTPQEIALVDVRRAINMFKKVNVDIIGIIQNMSYFHSDEDEKKIYLFGKDGVKKESEKLNINFLGEIPLIEEISRNSDQGIPIASVLKTKSSEKFTAIARNVISKINKKNDQKVKIEFE